ncbi:hypothetical protein K490DRAFT_70624 [Saccharata proteae CBS 121410]|uniref:Btz domain-containing protein n=1 Tax=Saccharata proteae CBS 121410 TaxID=1314787 RepID=A0A9P4M059_9PEZI|nr:hypothetical protein K490DRAFT_70624 [Saccharata proteae CBS 121410]
MALPRRRNLLRRRRRDAEDDEGAIERADDSQSEASYLSEEDADADASDLSDLDSVATTNGASKQTNGLSKAAPPSTTFTPMADTEAMMNGLKVADTDEGIDFADLDGQVSQKAPAVAQATVPQPAGGKQPETLADRRRREHEEYKKKRDEDPAFIPNRGAFFMHDHRSPAPGQNGFRPYGRGRGRGRGAVGGPFSPANMTAREPEATSGPWTHDLHETLEASGPSSAPNRITDSSMHDKSSSSLNAKASKSPPVRSFSSTRHVANARITISLPGMKAPIIFSAVPVKEHTRLPNHRPPLRRDKPVRISLPDQPPRYIFPAVERSFIFIPRALRPNQQGFGRDRNRFGSFGGGISSRRTSAYGGSVYSPSVALSRRSSMAREFGVISPAGSVMSRPGPMDAGRPVVRLPPGSQQYPGSGMASQPASAQGTANHGMNLPQQHYPLPQRPAYRENWATPLTMHQPKPQKTVSVAGIETPASLGVHAPQQQEQLPFHQQMPVHVNGQPAPNEQTGSFYQPHSRQLSYPSQISNGTPLTNIPERAIHAQPFQPFQPGYPPQGFGAPSAFYYSPASGQAQYPGGMQPGAMVPMYVANNPQGGYVMPAVAATVPAQAASSSVPPTGMVAHEQNGMVYYYDPSQLYTPVDGYAQAGYTVPGMGGMMTPSPDGYYYPQVPQPGTVFYQSQ